jgi:hypothetical protein
MKRTGIAEVLSLMIGGAALAAMIAAAGCANNADEGPGQADAAVLQVDRAPALHDDAAPPEDAAPPPADGGAPPADAAAPQSDAAVVAWDGTPPFDTVGTFAATIPPDNDPADVYYPNPPDLGTGGYAFPLALMLQGAKVDKQYYAKFAQAMARHGFIVVVPNHVSSGLVSGLYPVVNEAVNVLAFFKQQASDTTSPLHGAADTATMVVLGHSYGGVTGMYAVANKCQISFCNGSYTRPAELKGGAFYGTNLKGPLGNIPAYDNQGLPVGLVQGTVDGKALPADAQTTYDKISGTPKALIRLTGANHYGVADANNPTGADADSSAQTLDHEVGVATIARWEAAFLRAFVLQDPGALAYLHGQGPVDPNVTLTVVP